MHNDHRLRGRLYSISWYALMYSYSFLECPVNFMWDYMGIYRSARSEQT